MLHEPLTIGTMLEIKEYWFYDDFRDEHLGVTNDTMIIIDIPEGFDEWNCWIQLYSQNTQKTWKELMHWINVAIEEKRILVVHRPEQT